MLWHLVNGGRTEAKLGSDGVDQGATVHRSRQRMRAGITQVDGNGLPARGGDHLGKETVNFSKSLFPGHFHVLAVSLHQWAP